MARRSGWTSAVALAAAVVSAAAPLRAADEHHIPLDRLAGGLWTLRAEISPDHRPLTLLVDTGADRTVLSRAAATLAGLAVTDGAHLGTPTGSLGAGEARVPALAMGGRRLSDVKVLVADLRSLGRGARIDGILGMDLLAATAVVFDFDRGLLTLTDGLVVAPPAGVALTTRVLRGRLVVDAHIDGRPRALVLDTGAEMLVLFEPPRRRGRSTTFGTAAGGGVGRVVRSEVAVGAARLGTMPVLHVTSSATRTGSDGVLPGQAFSRLHIARDAGVVHVVPRRGR